MDLSAGLQDVDLSRSTSVCGPSSIQSGGHSVGLVSVSTSCDAFVVDSVLCFVKAFRLRGDKESLKSKMCERFSGAAVCTAKKLLWDSCAEALRSLNLPFQQRRDSDKRKQITADVEDLLLAFDALDSVDSIPPIFCEASELFKLPPISLDPVAEQVEKNSLILKDLTSVMSRLESKFSSCFQTTSNVSTEDHSAEQQAESTTYAHKVASFTPTTDAISSSHPFKVAKPDRSFDRDSNLVLFGLSESHSLIESKEIVDEVLEFLAGKPIVIRDVFRLGKTTRSHSASPQARPRPVLIKLSVAWDRKLVLLRKRKLKNFRIERLFVREDLPIELRQHKALKISHTDAQVGGNQSSEIALSDQQHGCMSSQRRAVAHSSVSLHAVSLDSASASGLPVRCRSGSPTALLHTHSHSRSLSPSSLSTSSSCSTSTLVQDSHNTYHRPT